MKTSSFLFNGYIYPMETTSTSDTTYISVRIPDLSEEMILNKTPFKALLQCVCSRDNYSISSYSGTRMKVAFSFNGIARDTEVRVYPYNTIYKDIYEYGEEIPSVTYSNGGLYLVEYMNKRTTILPISNLADISRMSNNEYFFPFDVHISGINMSLKQLAEVVNELSETSSGTVHTDSKGNIVSSADVKANSGAISLVTISQAIETLKTAQAEQLQSIQNLTKLTSTLQEALNNLQMDLDNVVVYTNEGDIIFKDSKSVEVSLRRFYESVAPAVTEYGETLSSHSDTLQTLSQTVTRLGETVSSMESDVSGYGSSIEELQNNLIAVSKTVADLIDSLDLSKYLTLDKNGNANIPNDVFFNGSELPEDYRADTQSLIDVITLLADNITTIQGTIEDMEETLSSAVSNLQNYADKLNSNLSDNEFDLKANTFVDSKIINSSGVETTAGGWKASDYVLISSTITEMIFTFESSGETTSLAFYDENKNVLLAKPYDGNKIIKVTVPPKSKYFRYTVNITDSTHSVKGYGITRVVKQQNESLANYGLDNKSNKSWVQGVYGSAGTLVSSYHYGVADTNYHTCSSDNIVSVKMDNLESVDIVWYNGTTMLNRVSSSATNGKAVAVAPTNTTQFLYSVRKAESGDALTPNNVKDVYLYVGNEIDSIKKDLSDVKTELLCEELQITGVNDNIHIISNNSFVKNGVAFVDILFSEFSNINEDTTLFTINKPKFSLYYNHYDYEFTIAVNKDGQVIASKLINSKDVRFQAIYPIE